MKVLSIFTLATCLTVGAASVGVQDAVAAQGRASNVRITLVDTRTDGPFLINISSQFTGSPACVTVPDRMSGDARTPGGAALLKTALLALALQAPVSIEGYSVCQEYGGIESLHLIQVQPPQ